MFQIGYDPLSDPDPSSEVLSRMRDKLVGDVRARLLTGLFAERPDDLNVYGNVVNNVIELTVKDYSNSKEFTKAIPVAEFLGAAGGTESSENMEESPGENLFTPRIDVLKRQSVEKFRNEKDIESVQEEVLSVAREKAADFVSEFMAVKSK
jgi:hypothetical protein